MRTFFLGLMAAITLAVTATAALADDWTVTRLRGTVQQMVDGQWQPLARGSVVPDERSIFTRSNGYATLVRGNEAIELGPNTKIEIYDRGGRKPFTTILQHAGTLSVEAEVRNVQHFAVKTPYLAAVVKGTRFTVTAKRSGGSVEVFRGQVRVEDNLRGDAVLILPGQKATVAKSGMKVTGKPEASGKPAGKSIGSGKSPGASTSTAGGSGTSGRSVGKTGTSTQTAEDKTTTSEDKSPKTGVVVQSVSNVVDTTTTTVTHVVTTTASTVDNVVDTATDAVDTVADTVDKVTDTSVVGKTVGTVTKTLDNTTEGLTGLLGKKPKGS